ncbi:MAG: AraC family transcriptional regulator, partial [Bacteroidetes bacterium]
FELCKHLKTNEKTAHIPVILLTAKTAFDSKMEGLKYGADTYMTKPFNTEELRLRIENLLENRQKAQAQYLRLLAAKQMPTDFEDNELPPDEKVISLYDQNFLNTLFETVKNRLDDETLDVEALAKEAAMSRVQLYRKTKALLNQTPSEYINNTRLEEAKLLLQKRMGNVSEVAFQVGFSSPKYFSTKFKEKFGVRPSEI